MTNNITYNTVKFLNIFYSVLLCA